MIQELIAELTEIMEGVKTSKAKIEEIKAILFDKPVEPVE